eukprot:Blabericola_migrator_1__1166@NODE_12_length_24658_cov_176_683258_g9_i0_p1_GENE_NODE_12_length_24658_cov_176_683258_g9_i0NODE_12_length_24658_cov_176_683258_g9_i0_p1_ORF_typecomplete_len1077_score215_26RhoGAP/PF00620_27/0_0016_NODE_12_length_24658_cov_176_683258_g9_i048728102
MSLFVNQKHWKADNYFFPANTMWPFGGGGNRKADTHRSHQSQATTANSGARSLQNYLEYKREDVNLKLTPERVRTLKKILYYHSTLSTTRRDYDIFAVSWDVNYLPEPPDDISPLLPPDAWGEPDMIAIGIQRCPVAAAPLWSVVVAHSVHRYSPLFKPISTEAPFDERSGNLVILFVRQDLIQYVSGYSSKLVGSTPPNAAALRFSFHQSSLAFICGKLVNDTLDGFSVLDPLAGLDKEKVDDLDDLDLQRVQKQMASEALLRQKFASMANSLLFEVEGKIVNINEHPVVVWMGMKDYIQKSQREERLANAIFLDSKRSLYSPSTPPPALDPTNPFAALESHSFDIRAVKKVMMGPPSCHQFGTYASLLCRSTRCRVDILKAGVMRLVLELLDDSGVPTPSEAAPELVFLRATIPTVDANQLRDLYLRSWRILRNVESTELPQIRLEPHLVSIPRPLSPWVPYTFSFKIVNSSSNKLPAPFTIFCVSDSGHFVLPLGRHSFLHQSRVVPKSFKRLETAAKMSSFDTHVPHPETKRGRKGGGSVEIVPASPLLTADIQKKVGALKKLAGRNLGHSWLMRTARGAPKSRVKEEARVEGTGTPRLATARSRSNKGLLSGFLPPKYKKSKGEAKSDTLKGPGKEVTPESSDTRAVAEECLSTGVSSSASPTSADPTPASSPAPTAPDFTLTKWMLVEPLEGVVLHGKEVEVQVTILIQEGFLEQLELVEPITLVVRVDDCSRDFFLGLEIPKISVSLDGLTPGQLMELGSVPLKPRVDEELSQPLSADRQRTYIASPATARVRRRSFLTPPPAAKTSQQSGTLPMPKEVWHLLSFVHQRIIYDLDSSNAMLPASWLNPKSPVAEDSVGDAWFCLPLFLQRASRGWETTAPRVRQDMLVVRNCVETHEQIPPSVSIEAALRALERWVMSLPVPLVPREYITEITQDEEQSDSQEGHVHFVCRAVLLSLPMVARNILLSLTALIRELLMFHRLTSAVMTRHMLSAIVQTPSAPCPSLKAVLGAEERAKVLNHLTKPTLYNGVDDTTQALVSAVCEWMIRFVLRDTPATLALPFIGHFIRTT